MKIAFNPSTVAALITPPNNKDITFDLRGRNIFARGVKFCGTDTWRDIKINNVSIGSNILDLRNGSNTTLTNTNGVVTINSTWRPVVDNLTSDSTTSSLSAKQGKILKSLIDGKSDSGHNHDDRYLKLTGGTMASNALITFADSGSWGTDKGPQGARGGLYWTGQSDYAKLYAEETREDNLDLVIQFGDDNSNGLSIRNKDNTQTSYISSSGVITTGTFKGNLDWSYITNKPATATRWPSWAEVTGKPSSFTPSTHTHGLSNSVFFLNMPSISGNAKWKEVFGYPVNYNLLLSVRINSPAPEWCVGNYGSGILYGGSDTKGFMSSAYNEPLIMWAGGNGSSDDSVPKWYIGIKGIHKSIYNLATIASEANAAYNLRHSHANKSVLDGITSALVNNWNTAYTFVNTITGTDTDKVINKWDEIVNFLAGITEDNKLNTLLNSKLAVYELANNTNVGTIKNNGIYYSTSDASSGTLTNSPFNTGFTLINMTSLDNGDDLRRSRLAFNAYGEIKVSDDRDLANTAETWYNVLTSKNSGISGSTIKLNGTSITVYSSSTADGRYVKKTGDTMSGALNFANNTWNKVGDDSYMGDCNVSGHFGIKAANTTYPGIAFFNNSGAHLGSLTAYNGNIKYGAYSLRFLDNGNTSVGASTWTNPFSGYNSNAVADGQAICVWGQSSSLSNLAADSGDMSLWLKRVNAKAATLNMVLDGEYYANGNLRLAHVSEIPNSLKNPYSLTTFGVVYDGSAAKTVTTSNFISLITEGTDTVTDGTMFITSWASNSGFADTNAVNVPYKRKAIHLWEYVRAKTDSLYATKSHNHDDRYLKLTGGIMTGTINRRSGGSTISGRDHAIIRLTYAPGGSSWNPIACVDTETGTWTLGHLSSGSSDTNFHFCFSTNADYNAGNNNGNYVTLRNKVGTIALLSDIPSSLKNPHALTISLNGTSLGPYDGSTAKNINITPSSIGAATSGHNHDGRYVYNYGGTQMDGASINKNALGMATNSGITGDWWHILQAAWNSEYRWNSLIAFPTLNRNGMYYRSGLDDNTKWGSWVKLLDIGNSYVTGGKGVINGTTITQVDNATNANNASVASKVYGQVGDTGSHELVRCDMNNDQFRIIAGSNGNNNGWAEIATADDGNEPIYVRQYTGVFSSVRRTLTLLDGSGNTTFPGSLSIGGNIIFPNSSHLLWNSGSWYLRILLNDDSTADTSVFTFLQSSDSGTNWSNLMTIRDNGKVIANTFVGALLGNASTASKLQTSRLLWGQPFNGTANVDGTINISGTSGSYNQGIRIHTFTNSVVSSIWFRATNTDGYQAGMWGISVDDNGMRFRGNTSKTATSDPIDYMNILHGGNVGIGSTNPSSKLTVNGVGDDKLPVQLISASRDSTWVYNASFLAPNLTSNHNNAIFIGKAHNTCNAFGLTHMHIKDGSASNYAALEVWGVGNVLRWYYDRHSAFLHRADFSSLGSDASYMNSALLIREHGYNGTQADTWANAPRMSWHWSGRVQTQIGLGSNNELYLSKDNFSNRYRLMYETGTWGINITGNANNATNADKLDGYHASAFVKIKLFRFNQYNQGTWTKILTITINSTADLLPVINFSWIPSECSRTIWADFSINWRSNSPIFYAIWKGMDSRTLKVVNSSGAIWDVWVSGSKTDWDPFGEIQVTYTHNITSYNGGSLGYSDTDPGGTICITGGLVNYATLATKLQTPRTIWGQRFDGTADVNGTIYINNSDSSNGAIRLNNDRNSNARISAISDQVIFNTGSAIRFGETAWDWNQWAGLKYTHSNKTIYLGIADGSIFNANSALVGGTLNFRAGVSTILAPNINFGNTTSGLGYGLEWTCGDNDFARIKAGATGSNAGYLEIATADDGTEPIYVRQYTGVFSSVKRTLTLLDANGYTHFPSYINIGGNENNNSSPDRVWGSNGSDSYLRSYRTSALRVSYASSAGSVAWSNVTGKPTMPSNITATTALIVTISGSTVTVNANLDAYKTPGEFNIFGTSNGDYAKMYVQSGIGDAFNGTRVITQTIKVTISHNTYAEICDVTRLYKSNAWSKWTIMYLGND